MKTKDQTACFVDTMSTDSATEQGACFPAGTRVITDKGPVPIEQIKVGDKVLSKPESGEGEPAFKPVVRTVSHENKALWQLTYVEIKPSTDISKLTASKLKQLSMKGHFTVMEATPNHPFWVEGVGWTRLDELEYGQIIHSKNENRYSMVFSISPLLATNIPNIAAEVSSRNILDAHKKGQEIDDTDYFHFRKYGTDGYIEEFINDGDDAPSPLLTDEYGEITVTDKAYTTTVYNFEVEDYHTYYVWDLWAHNTNCNDKAVLTTHADLANRNGEQEACFTAWMRVMTDKGLVPIDQIKVGDRVLSKPENNNGAAEFKSVSEVFVHENKEIWNLTYVEIKPSTNIAKLTTDKLKQLSRKEKFSWLEATPNHPFWVEGQGWTRLDELEYGQIIQSKKDALCMVFSVNPTLATNIENVAAGFSDRNILDADKKGQDIDDVDYFHYRKYAKNGYIEEFLNDGHDSPSPLLTDEYGEITVTDKIYTTTVYHFEVEDYHTYYVWDLWVHDIA